MAQRNFKRDLVGAVFRLDLAFDVMASLTTGPAKEPLSPCVSGTGPTPVIYFVVDWIGSLIDPLYTLIQF